MGELFDQLQVHNTSQPGAHEVAAAMREVADSYPGDRVLIGEIYLPVAELMPWYGTPERPEVVPFNFGLIGAEWRADVLHALIAEYLAALPPGATPTWVLGNHDRPRIAARVGEAQAKVAAVLLLTLGGSPTIYYGDELGLADVPIPPNRVQDPAELRNPGLGVGRDPVRTPMPWDASPNAGFTTGEPWLPLNADWRERNVEAQWRTDQSMALTYRVLLGLRRLHPALREGELILLPPQGDVLAYERRTDGERMIVTLNLGATEQRWEGDFGRVTPLFSTGNGPLTEKSARHVLLKPNEAVLFSRAAT